MRPILLYFHGGKVTLRQWDEEGESGVHRCFMPEHIQ